MILIVLAMCLVLGIAFYQVATQGLFSALIMAILTIMCAAAAFTFYEPLAAKLLYTRQPAHADAVVLIALFVIPLLVLRIVMDRFFHRNVVLGVWADRIGGGALGLITGMVLVGVLLIALQMLPVGSGFLTYEPFDGNLQRNQRLWPFCPDEFTLGLMDILSAGALSGTEERTPSSVHDDLILELFCARNTAGKNGRVDAKPGQIKVVGAFAPKNLWADCLPDSPTLEENVTNQVIIVIVDVSEKARDKDNWWRLPLTHFRLISNAGKSHYPLGNFVIGEVSRVEQTSTIVPHRLEGITDKPEKDGSRRSSRRSRRKGIDVLQNDEKMELPDDLTNLIIQRNWDKGPEELRLNLVYRLPLKEKPAELVFRRVARDKIGKMKPALEDRFELDR